ncbi:hypothetical protein [Bacillus pinisoli]|nr:hypothetical protein [Bacillus pinisoli]
MYVNRVVDLIHLVVKGKDYKRKSLFSGLLFNPYDKIMLTSEFNQELHDV